jgi:hypothetical protein
MPSVVQVEGLPGGVRTDESIEMRAIGRVYIERTQGVTHAHAEIVRWSMDPQEALQLVEAVSRALAQLGYDVVNEAHGKRRG